MDNSKQAFPTSKRKTENYMDAGGYGRTRTVTVEEGGMTQREYAAVNLNVADSGDEQIDAMIRKANRQHYAGLAMQGICSIDQSGCSLDKDDAELLAEEAILIADALIAKLEETK